MWSTPVLSSVPEVSKLTRRGIDVSVTQLSCSDQQRAPADRQALGYHGLRQHVVSCCYGDVERRTMEGLTCSGGGEHPSYTARFEYILIYCRPLSS